MTNDVIKVTIKYINLNKRIRCKVNRKAIASRWRKGPHKGRKRFLAFGMSYEKTTFSQP